MFPTPFTKLPVERTSAPGNPQELRENMAIASAVN
jgi:hypothetical protein